MKNEKIFLVDDDITTLQVDAIVNAANSSLLGGGGVDGAIHRAAGERLLEACRAIGGCATGEARITPGFDLPARWVIHTVGPVWRGGRHGEPEQLAACYRNSFQLAAEHGVSRIAFPAISTGVYGYPKRSACHIAVAEAARAVAANPDLSVVFVCFDAGTQAAYESAVHGDDTTPSAC